MDVTGLRIAIDASGAKSGEQSFNASLDSMSSRARTVSQQIGGAFRPGEEGFKSFAATARTVSTQVAESLGTIRYGFRGLLDSVLNFRTLFDTAIAGISMRGIIDQIGKVQDIKFALQATTGSAAQAGAAWKMLEADAEKFGFVAEDLALKYARLSMATRGTSLEGARTATMLRAAEVAARALGSGSEGAERSLQSFTNILSVARVQGDMMVRQLARFGGIPDAMGIAARAFGVSVDTMRQKLKEGTIGSEEFLSKFTQRMVVELQPAAERSAQGISAWRERVTGAFKSLADDMSTGGLSGVIVGFLKELRDTLASPAFKEAAAQLGGLLTTALRSLGSAIQFAGQHIGLLKTAIVGLIAFEVIDFFANFAKNVLILGLAFKTATAEIAAFATAKAAATTAGTLGAVAAAFAGGGVMTARGPALLQRYAAGGVANSPQTALFGEGSKPEAFIPLQDGRSIPVTMKMNMVRQSDMSPLMPSIPIPSLGDAFVPLPDGRKIPARIMISQTFGMRRYATGGVADTPQTAIYGEAGPEARIPLDRGAIPVQGVMQKLKEEDAAITVLERATNIAPAGAVVSSYVPARSIGTTQGVQPITSAIATSQEAVRQTAPVPTSPMHQYHRALTAAPITTPQPPPPLAPLIPIVPPAPAPVIQVNIPAPAPLIKPLDHPIRMAATSLFARDTPPPAPFMRPQLPQEYAPTGAILTPSTTAPIRAPIPEIAPLHQNLALTAAQAPPIKVEIPSLAQVLPRVAQPIRTQAAPTPPWNEPVPEPLPRTERTPTPTLSIGSTALVALGPIITGAIILARRTALPTPPTPTVTTIQSALRSEPQDNRLHQIGRTMIETSPATATKIDSLSDTVTGKLSEAKLRDAVLPEIVGARPAVPPVSEGIANLMETGRGSLAYGARSAQLAGAAHAAAGVGQQMSLLGGAEALGGLGVIDVPAASTATTKVVGLFEHMGNRMRANWAGLGQDLKANWTLFIRDVGSGVETITSHWNSGIAKIKALWQSAMGGLGNLMGTEIDSSLGRKISVGLANKAGINAAVGAESRMAASASASVLETAAAGTAGAAAGELTGGLTQATGATSGLGAALGLLATPIGIAIAAVAALAVGLYAVRNNQVEINGEAFKMGDIYSGIWTKIKAAAATFWSWMKIVAADVWGSIGILGKGAIDGIFGTGATAKVEGYLGKAWEGFKGLFYNVAKDAKTAREQIESMAQAASLFSTLYDTKAFPSWTRESMQGMAQPKIDRILALEAQLPQGFAGKTPVEVRTQGLPLPVGVGGGTVRVVPTEDEMRKAVAIRQEIQDILLGGGDGKTQKREDPPWMKTLKELQDKAEMAKPTALAAAYGQDEVERLKQAAEAEKTIIQLREQGLDSKAADKVRGYFAEIAAGNNLLKQNEALEKERAKILATPSLNRTPSFEYIDRTRLGGRDPASELAKAIDDADAKMKAGTLTVKGHDEALKAAAVSYVKLMDAAKVTVLVRPMGFENAAQAIEHGTFAYKEYLDLVQREIADMDKLRGASAEKVAMYEKQAQADYMRTAAMKAYEALVADTEKSRVEDQNIQRMAVAKTQGPEAVWQETALQKAEAQLYQFTGERTIEDFMRKYGPILNQPELIAQAPTGVQAYVQAAQQGTEPTLPKAKILGQDIGVDGHPLIVAFSSGTQALAVSVREEEAAQPPVPPTPPAMSAPPLPSPTATLGTSDSTMVSDKLDQAIKTMRPAAVDSPPPHFDRLGKQVSDLTSAMARGSAASEASRLMAQQDLAHDAAARQQESVRNALIRQQADATFLSAFASTLTTQLAKLAPPEKFYDELGSGGGGESDFGEPTPVIKRRRRVLDIRKNEPQPSTWPESATDVPAPFGLVLPTSSPDLGAKMQDAFGGFRRQDVNTERDQAIEKTREEVVAQFDPGAALKDKLTLLRMAWDDNKISVNQYNMAVQQAEQTHLKAMDNMLMSTRNMVNGAKAAFTEWGNSATDAASHAKTTVDSLMSDLTDDITKSMLGDKVKFKNVWQDLEKNTVKSFVETQITGPLASQVGGLIKPQAGGQGTLPSIIDKILGIHPKATAAGAGTRPAGTASDPMMVSIVGATGTVMDIGSNGGVLPSGPQSTLDAITASVTGKPAPGMVGPQMTGVGPYSAAGTTAQGPLGGAVEWLNRGTPQGKALTELRQEATVGVGLSVPNTNELNALTNATVNAPTLPDFMNLPPSAFAPPPSLLSTSTTAGMAGGPLDFMNLPKNAFANYPTSLGGFGQGDIGGMDTTASMMPVLSPILSSITGIASSLLGKGGQGGARPTGTPNDPIYVSSVATGTAGAIGAVSSSIGAIAPTLIGATGYEGIAANLGGFTGAGVGGWNTGPIYGGTGGGMIPGSVTGSRTGTAGIGGIISPLAMLLGHSKAGGFGAATTAGGDTGGGAYGDYGDAWNEVPRGGGFLSRFKGMFQRSPGASMGGGAASYQPSDSSWYGSLWNTGGAGPIAAPFGGGFDLPAGSFGAMPDLGMDMGASAMPSLADAAAPDFMNLGADAFDPSMIAGLFAEGGIMSSRGRIPLLHYQGGGIATTPQLAMFGEGSSPEAYVPVPSGRIPVEMRGSAGKGGVTHNDNSVTNHNNWTINTPDADSFRRNKTQIEGDMLRSTQNTQKRQGNTVT